LVVVIAYRGMWLPKSILILVLSPHSATNPKKARIRDSLWIRFFLFLFPPIYYNQGFSVESVHIRNAILTHE